MKPNFYQKLLLDLIYEANNYLLLLSIKINFSKKHIIFDKNFDLIDRKIQFSKNTYEIKKKVYKNSK
jgi:hypothetical protein